MSSQAQPTSYEGDFIQPPAEKKQEFSLPGEEISHAKKSVGEHLRDAREQKGLSIQEVADQLYLEQRIIRLLEADDYEQLPPPAFVQGYIRAYAKLLGLAGENLIQSYRRQRHPHYPPLHVQDTTDQRQTASSKDSWHKWLTFVIVIVFMALVALWRQTTQTPSPTAAENAGEPASPAPAVTEVPLEIPPLAEKSPETPSAENASGAAPLTASASATEPVELPPAIPEVVIRVNKDSWVRITDAKKVNLYAATAKGGEVIAKQGTPPFKLVLGRPANVSVEYQGKPVELDQSSGRKNIRLTVGE